MWRAPVLLLFALAPLVLAQPNVGPAPRLTLSALPTADDAYALALADIQTLPEFDRPYVRYVWCVPELPQEEAFRGNAFVLNTISRATVTYRPEVIGQDRLMLQRVDLRQLAPRAADLRQFSRVWEELQFAPRLNLLVTKGALKFIARAAHWSGEAWVGRWVQKKDKGWFWSFGKERVTLSDVKGIEIIRVPRPDLNNGVRAELERLTGSLAPLVPHDYLTFRALRAVKDRGVYAIIWGGLYYDLAGIGTGFKKGTDEDNLFDSLGVGNIAQGLTARKVYARLRSDQRVAMFRSKVTSNPRAIELLPIPTPRPDDAQGIISVSHDLRRQDVDVDTHPVMNLLDYVDNNRRQASEVLWVRSNGMRGAALFNNKGARQDEVPPDIAANHTIPDPHHTRLEPFVGCMDCHDAKGHDGWIPVHNAVAARFRDRRKLDVFGDLNDLGRVPRADTVDRLAGLYAGDFERAFQRGRDDYARAVLRATGPWSAKYDTGKGQANVVQVTAKAVQRTYRGYYYGDVTPRRALAELGLEVKGGEAKQVLELLNAVLRPDLRAAAQVEDAVFVLEDPRLGFLREGEDLDRFSWELAIPFAFERTRANLAALLKAKQMGPNKDDGGKK